MIDLFFVSNYFSGASTYTAQLCSTISNYPDIKVYVIYLESSVGNEFSIIEEQGRTSVHFPSCKSMPLYRVEKYIERCIDLLLLNVQVKNKVIIHVNAISQLKFGTRMKERIGGRFIFTMHFLPRTFTLNRRFDPIVTHSDSSLMKQADAIICVTRFAEDVLCKHYHIAPDKTRVIYNGYANNIKGVTSKERAGIKVKLGFDASEKLILFVGRIEKDKGVDYLIKAFNRLALTIPGVRLIIAGSGNYEEYFSYCRMNWSRITFTGHLDHELLTKFYQVCDIGVIPSLVEQCSYVALEMMAHRLPVIAFDIPGLNEVLTTRNAFLVSCNTNKDLHSKEQGEALQNNLLEQLERALHNPGKTEIFKNQAYDSWKSQFTMEKMGTKTMQLYKELTAEKSH